MQEPPPFLRLLSLILFISLVAPTYSSHASGQSVTLLEEGGELAPIVVASPEPADLQRLRSTLLPFFQSLTKRTATFHLQNEDSFPSPALVLEIVNDPALRDGSYHVKTVDGRVHISGNSIYGVKYGFYDLMERLGCRFWSRDEEILPVLTELVIPSTDFKWKPPFRMHDIMSQEAQTPHNDFRFKSRAVSPLQFTGGHNIQPLLKPYSEKHPEILPLTRKKDKDGNLVIEGRKFNNLHYCYIAPGIAEALAEAMIPDIEKRERNLRNFIYFAGMGDWYGGQCFCEPCKAVYEEETWTNEDGVKAPGYSATLLRMINRVAEILDEKYPGIQVGTFAYMSLEAPPALTKPRKNVVLWVPRLRHSAVLPANDPSSKRNRPFWLNLKRWNELAPGRVYVWEYGANFHHFLVPYPVLNVIAKNIKAYHELGIAGIMIQGNYASMGGDAAVMNNYVWSRLMRDPQLNTEKVIREFTDQYYGPAAPTIRRYIEKLESVTLLPQYREKEFDEFVPATNSYLTPELRGELEALISEARQTITTPEERMFLERVNDLGLGLGIARLWNQGPLHEENGKLVRTDFGRDTFPEIVELKKQNRRRATPTEFNAWRGPWLTVQHYHGGPIRRARHGTMELVAHPTKRVGFGPFFADGRPVFTETALLNVQLGTFPEPAKANELLVEADSGISSWQIETLHKLRRHVTFPAPNTMQIDETLQAARNKEEVATPVFTTHWTPPNPIWWWNQEEEGPFPWLPDELQFEWQDTAGTWHPIDNFPVSPTVPIELQGSFAAWRVTTPFHVVTDEYQLKTPDSPEMTAKLHISRDRNRTLYTSVTVRVEKVPPTEPLLFLRRVIRLEKR